MTLENCLWAVGGVGLGFLLSLAVLNNFYKSLMKKVIDEIHVHYSKALDMLKEEYETNKDTNS